MSKASYKIVEMDDRLFFHDGTQFVLLDTGFFASPWGPNSVSVNGKIGPFRVSKMPSRFFETFIDPSMDEGTAVRAVLNPMDGYDCLLQGDTLTISDEELVCPPARHFLEFTHGKLPLVDGSLNGKKCTFLFDSGARMTMLNEAPQGGTPCRTYREWMALLHTFEELPVYEAALEFADHFQYKGEGALVDSAPYKEGASRMGFQAVLGIDFFKKYDLFLAVKGKRRGIALLEKQ